MNDELKGQAAILAMSAWDMYASALLGFNAHPGTTRDAAQPKSLESIAAQADEMLRLRLLRFPIDFANVESTDV